MAKAALIVALLAAATAASSAVAEPRTVVCGPFGYEDNGKHYATRAITFVIDPAAGTAQYIDDDGHANAARITERTDHIIAVGFMANLLRRETNHTIYIDNDQQTARLYGAYLDIFFEPGPCRSTARFLW